MKTAPVILICGTLIGVRATSATVYSNYDYGFSVIIPDGFPIEHDQPPAPNHGFGVTLGRDREVSVFADYDDLTDSSAAAALRRDLNYAHWAAGAPLRRIRLAGLPAAIAARNIGERRASRMIAFRAHDGQIAVLYHSYIDTDSAHASHDNAVFQAILRGFSLQPLPD